MDLHFSQVIFGRLPPYIVFTSPEVSGTSGTMSIYIYIYIYVYVNNMADVKLVQIFRLDSGEIHLFVPDFISEECFRPEEFFEVLV